MQFGIRSRRVVTPRGVRSGTVLVKNGIIMGVEETPPGAWPVQEVGDLVVMPGLVDTHVHCNEPGRTQWEGFETATKAAAAGGITTVIDMPLNSSPVTTTVQSLDEKIDATEGQLYVDLGFHGGLIEGNEDRMVELVEGGVFGVKAFLVPSGISEFPAATEAELRVAMPTLARFTVPLLVHAELEGPLPSPTSPRSYVQYMASRPRDWENDAVRLLIRLCREFNCPTHIVHLSSSDVIADIERAKDEGLPLTVETCPHYLFFEAERIPDGDTRFKCAPPIREGANREKLWAALGNGAIDSIASDHSPCDPELKCLDAGDFAKAWGGISSLQLGLPVVWTEARARGFTLADVATWMALRPARTVALDGRKGAIQAGYDADFTLFDPDAQWTIQGNSLEHRHKVTPYEGTNVTGRVRATFLRGRQVYLDGAFPVGPTGEAIFRRIGGCYANEEVE